jgi:DNA (cytosine-5)-methyltransferase 1
VLRKHWKDVPIYDDVRTIDATRLGTIDIVAGGFPCQAVSQAGLQKATEDDRWLWDEMLRIIQDCKPRWVIGENVVGLININQGILFEQVQTDLEKEGYSVQSVVIPAASKNAPHRRDRVWIIAHSNINSQSNKSVNEKWLGDVSNTKRNTKRPTYRSNQRRNSRGWEVKNISEWNEMGSNIGNDSCIDGETENVSDTISQRGCSRETRREDAKDVRERSTSEKHRSRNFKCRMGYMADGISEALSGHFSEEPKDIPRVATNQKDRTKKLKALGNSIVPQVVAELFYAIRIAEYGE